MEPPRLVPHASKARLTTYLIALWKLFKHPDTPRAARWTAIAVLAYALSPIDLIPDFIPVLGLLDDLILVPLGIALAVRLTPKPLWEACLREAELSAQKLPAPLVGRGADRRALARAARAAGVVALVLVGLVGLARWRSALRRRRISAMPTIRLIGIRNSRNSKLPSPPSGAKPKIFSMKSMRRLLGWKPRKCHASRCRRHLLKHQWRE
jgi:uncharacterized membrane protein YkvA (DUF1232 family)